MIFLVRNEILTFYLVNKNFERRRPALLEPLMVSGDHRADGFDILP